MIESFKTFPDGSVSVRTSGTVVHAMTSEQAADLAERVTAVNVERAAEKAAEEEAKRSMFITDVDGDTLEFRHAPENEEFKWLFVNAHDKPQHNVQGVYVTQAQARVLYEWLGEKL